VVWLMAAPTQIAVLPASFGGLALVVDALRRK
jgi:hypothetical protein